MISPWEDRMRWIAIVMAVACVPPEETDGGPKDKATGPTDGAPTDNVTTDATPPEDTAPTDTSTGIVPTGDTAPPYDCSILPTLPAPWVNIPGFDTSEDFDIDGDGYLCTNNSGNLACKDMYGNSKILSPNIGNSTAGIRILASGDWLINNVGAGSLVLVTAATGAQTTVVSGLAYPNGLEVDADGYAYIGENGAGNVRQIDVYSGAQFQVASGLSQPNGVILSPDEQTLYVGSFGGGVVYAVDRLGPTDWDTPRILFDPPPGDGGFDGINVDICGNVYVTEYIFGRVWRLTDDGGLGNGEVVDLSESWIPNMRWGHDINGWDSSTLYVTAWSSLYALEMGIQGKKHILMP